MLDHARILSAIESFGGAWVSTNTLRGELGYPQRQELLGKLYELSSAAKLTYKADSDQLFWRVVGVTTRGDDASV